MKENFKKIAFEIAELVAEKNKAYGNSFNRSGDVLRIYYPDGIRPDQYDDMLAMVRVIDKQFRIATAKDAFGESPWRDINGYSLLAVERNERQVVEIGPTVDSPFIDIDVEAEQMVRDEKTLQYEQEIREAIDVLSEIPEWMKGSASKNYKTASEVASMVDPIAEQMVRGE